MQALEVPEILRLVGDFLDYPRLAAATAVCKSWNTTFTPFLYHTLEWSFRFPRHPRSFVVLDNVDHIRVIKVFSPWIDPLTDCTNLEEVHFDLDLGDRDRDTSWIPPTTLIRHNPNLTIVCAIDPSNEFLSAAFTCCPQLKRLEFSGADMTSIMMTDLLFNVCLRLEELKMVDVTLSVGGHYDIPWDDWPAFPKIKKLWLGITHERYWFSHQTEQQHGFIKHCPNLESLTWSFSRGLLPIREIKDLLSPEKSPCPKIKAFAFHYPGFHPPLPEIGWIETLKACNKNLTSFGTRKTVFGELSSKTLIRSLASTLTRLHIRDHATKSVVMMEILSSCPHLVHVTSAGPLDVRDILGVKSTKPEDDEDEDWTTSSKSKRKNAVGPPKKQPLPKSIRPPEWACKNLQTLEIGICGLRDKASGWQREVLRQLAKLKQLRVLDVEGPYAETLDEGSRDGLDFRLAGGLDILGNLKMLETLRFGRVWQEMTRQDIDWMARAWPRFSSIQGWVHHEQSQRVKLKKLFKRHGITVEHCHEFEPPVQDDDDPFEGEEGDGKDRPNHGRGAPSTAHQVEAAFHELDDFDSYDDALSD
ncbi:MAG: hypothetical protein J3Q66DRAFT_329883 [Benniella sp.]|nr:MAG: hypothetical protein J3Q66DRAFT_329883 [Benniella sp.]